MVVNIFPNRLMNSVKNMVLSMRGCLSIHRNQSGLPREKNRTLTGLVNAMLDTIVYLRHDGRKLY
jgi:hypothetical protein